jgi:hypothetical protein
LQNYCIPASASATMRFIRLNNVCRTHKVVMTN